MSVDSCTVDVEDWLGPDTCTVGDVGGGLLGSQIPSSGTSGPGYAYPSLSLPADANKEICGRITYMPPGLAFAPEEDTSGRPTAADGTYTVMWQLIVDYIPTGPEVPITLTFGTGSVVVSLGWVEGADMPLIAAVVGGGIIGGISWTEANDTIAINGTVTVTPAAAIAWIEANDTVSIGGFVSGAGFTFDPDCIIVIGAQDCIVKV